MVGGACADQIVYMLLDEYVNAAAEPLDAALRRMGRADHGGAVPLMRALLTWQGGNPKALAFMAELRCPPCLECACCLCTRAVEAHQAL